MSQTDPKQYKQNGNILEVYSKPCQISQMALFSKVFPQEDPSQTFDRVQNTLLSGVVLCKKVLLESLFLVKLLAKVCNFTKKETLAPVFSCEFCEISNNTFFTEHLCATASIYCSINYALAYTRETFCNNTQIIGRTYHKIIFQQIAPE